MNKKAMPLLIILLLTISCLSIVSADNNTTDNGTAGEIDDLTNYIIPISITDNGIQFSDGFTGFCLDLSKDSINVDDKFTSSHTNNNDVENNVKLAIIECYKTGHENNIGNMVSQAINGNKKYDEVEALFTSSKISDDTITVNITNTTEATFTFELLKSANDGKSDCLAYKVSMHKVANDNVLAATNDDANDTLETATENNTPSNDTIAAAEGNNASGEKQGANEDAKSNENNNTQTEGTNDSENQTTVNETNKTIVNKTNTVVVNENNTTIINQKNVKVINKTNETPKNATVQDKIMRTVGNPIFLLVLVIVVVAIVAVVMRRKN